eukprot:2962842-Pleurochrysis_carterae.AAC.1
MLQDKYGPKKDVASPAFLKGKCGFVKVDATFTAVLSSAALNTLAVVNTMVFAVAVPARPVP